MSLRDFREKKLIEYNQNLSYTLFGRALVAKTLLEDYPTLRATLMFSLFPVACVVIIFCEDRGEILVCYNPL